MSELSKQINDFFNYTPKQEVKRIEDNLILSDHLVTVLRMRYIEGHDIEFIASYTGYSRGKIEADLRKIRRKIQPFL